MNALLLGIALIVGRGELIAQSELPYIDALPLEMKDRDKVIDHYRKQALKECDGAGNWWYDRAATRLYLRDLEQTWDAPYMLSRMQTRQMLWTWKPWADGRGGYWRWLDQD